MLSYPHAALLDLKARAFSPSNILDKSQIRNHLREERARQDVRLAQYKSARITERLLSLPCVQQAHCAASYASIDEEVDTHSINSSLINNGKTLALPKVIGNEIHFFHVQNLKRDLPALGAFGIREPDPARCAPIAIADIDLFLVPGVGFDPFGGRIGFGGGFYDRALSRKNEEAASIGLAYEFQMTHAIQTTSLDVPIDLTVTEECVYQPQFSTFTTNDESETHNAAHVMIERGLTKGDVLALHGGLGAGKTAFVKGLASALNAPETPSSPTFVFCREYHGTIPLYHADCYRLESIRPDEEEFWQEIIQSPGLIAIEWAERLGSILPKTTIHLFAETKSETKREWTLFTPLKKQEKLNGGRTSRPQII